MLQVSVSTRVNTSWHCLCIMFCYIIIMCIYVVSFSHYYYPRPSQLYWKWLYWYTFIIQIHWRDVQRKGVLDVFWFKPVLIKDDNFNHRMICNWGKGRETEVEQKRGKEKKIIDNQPEAPQRSDLTSDFSPAHSNFCDVILSSMFILEHNNENKNTFISIKLQEKKCTHYINKKSIGKNPMLTHSVFQSSQSRTLWTFVN